MLEMDASSSLSICFRSLTSRLNTAALLERDGIMLCGQVGGSLVGALMSLFFSPGIFAGLIISAFWVSIIISGILLALTLFNVHDTVITTFPIVTKVETVYVLILSLWMLIACAANAIFLSPCVLAGGVALFFFAADFYFKYKAYQNEGKPAEPLAEEPVPTVA